ncbi:MAG: ribonuclease P protein component [Patescibacteria group bacterium]
MPKKYRLSHADFVRLSRAKSRRVHGAYFFLTITTLPSSSGPKMASVVSKKVAARAVDRNKIERYCRESLRSHMARIRRPTALVFHAKREATKASFPEIRKDIDGLLARAGVLA